MSVKILSSVETSCAEMELQGYSWLTCRTRVINKLDKISGESTLIFGDTQTTLQHSVG